MVFIDEAPDSEYLRRAWETLHNLALRARADRAGKKLLDALQAEQEGREL